MTFAALFGRWRDSFLRLIFEIFTRQIQKGLMLKNHQPLSKLLTHYQPKRY
jgi:hypothetical protein